MGVKALRDSSSSTPRSTDRSSSALLWSTSCSYISMEGHPFFSTAAAEEFSQTATLEHHIST